MKHLNSILSTLAFGTMGMMGSLGHAQDAAAPAAKSSTAPTAKTAVDHATKPVDSAAKSVDGAAPKTADGAAAAKTDANKAKKKVIAKTKSAVEAGEEGAAAIGASKQEPKPGPYSSEIEADFAYATISGTTKQSDNSSIKDAGTSLNFSTTYQFIFGHFSAGPKLSYLTTTNKHTTPGSEGTSDIITTTNSSATGFGAAAQYFISDINVDKLVPYIGLSYVLQSGSSSSKTDGSDNTTKDTTSGNEMVLSAGVEYFLSRHITVKPGLAYQMTSTTTKNPDQDSSTLKTSTNTIGVVAGLAILL